MMTRVWILLVIALMLSSCTPGAAPTNAPLVAPTTQVSAASISTIDPCKLLDELTVARFFGVKPHPGIPAVASNSAGCTYTSDSGGDSMTVTVFLEDGQAKDSDDYTSARTATTSPVTGLGDEAYFSRTSSLLTVAKGPWMVTLIGAQKGKKADSTTLSRTMQLVVGRLPH